MPLFSMNTIKIIRVKPFWNKTVDSQRGFMDCSILFYKLYATCYDTLFLKNEESIQQANIGDILKDKLKNIQFFEKRRRKECYN